MIKVRKAAAAASCWVRWLLSLYCGRVSGYGDCATAGFVVGGVLWAVFDRGLSPPYITLKWISWTRLPRFLSSRSRSRFAVSSCALVGDGCRGAACWTVNGVTTVVTGAIGGARCGTAATGCIVVGGSHLGTVWIAAATVRDRTTVGLLSMSAFLCSCVKRYFGWVWSWTHDVTVESHGGAESALLPPSDVENGEKEL